MSIAIAARAAWRLNVKLALAGLVGLCLTVLLALRWDTSPDNAGALLPLLALPALLNLLHHRLWPWAVALAYFGTFNAELPGVIARHFPDSAAWQQWGAVPALTLVQSSPFLLYRADRPPAQRALRMAGVLLLLTLPPVGWLAWGNPLLLAGALYPHMGVAGLLAMLGLFAGLAGITLSPRAARATPGWRAAAGVGLASALVCPVALLLANRTPEPFYPWAGVETRIEPASLRDPWAVRDQPPGAILGDEAMRLMAQGAEVVVFPESVLSPLTPADQVAMMPAVVEARRRGAVILAGVVEPTGPNTWRNTIRAFGAQEGIVDESRLPMPIGNWRPGFGGVPARPFAPDVAILTPRGQPVPTAFSICYEDTLIWPHWGLLSGRARVMVSVANAWPTSGTRGDRVQTLSAHLLANLAGVPLVRARNTWETP